MDKSYEHGENITHNGNEPVIEVGKNLKFSSNNKHIYSDRVYLSHPEINQNLFSHNVMQHIKSSSGSSKYVDFKQRQLKLNEDGDYFNLLDKFKDSSSQTSKTILEIALSENDGRISPDSLMQSPKEEFVANSKGLLDYFPTTLKPHIEISSQDGNVKLNHNYDNLTFSRKKVLTEYLKKSEETHSSGIVSKNAIETNNVLCVNGDVSCDALTGKSKTLLSKSHSKFLQQTSPLKKFMNSSNDFTKNNFKSQSYVEDSVYFNQNRKTRASRFSVKSIKEKVALDSTTPVKYFCQKTSPISIEIIPKEASSDLQSQHSSSPERSSTGSKGQHSFMSPTIASEQKNKLSQVNRITSLISSSKAGKITSSKSSKVPSKIKKHPTNSKISYIAKSESEVVLSSKMIAEKESGKDINDKNKFATQLKPSSTKLMYDEQSIDNMSVDFKFSTDTEDITIPINDSETSETAVYTSLNKLKNLDWTTALKGLAEIVDHSHVMDPDYIFPHMTLVNQRLIELLRSPRSYVCRTACQAAGHLFETVKDVRRPEFDDIVDILLCKTADANKFIRQDANLSLDCMVTHMPTFHTIRALCAKGPDHKNPLVRTATVRLIICAVVIAGADTILNVNNNEHTRKRIILNMFKFIEDKSYETRKYGERLYKILHKEEYFEMFLKKYLEKEQLAAMKQNLKHLQHRK